MRSAISWCAETTSSARVVFLILVVINFMVITKGAGRIAEVAARFTLDAMPGKQMAIDAELNAGIIDEATATRRRYKMQKEADFYGAMDGASKFVRGDAVAGILITLINIIGGFAIGIVQKGMPIVEALQKYTLLSIGDGLVAQVPGADRQRRGRYPGHARFGRFKPRRAHHAASSRFIRAPSRSPPGCFSFSASCPACRSFPFVALGRAGRLSPPGSCSKSRAAAAAESRGAGRCPTSAQAKEKGRRAAKPVSEDFRKLIEVDVFAIELGYGLLNLAEKKNGGDLLDRVTGVRKTFAREHGRGHSADRDPRQPGARA